MSKNKKRCLVMALTLAIALMLVGSVSADANRALVLNHLSGCQVFDLDGNLVDVEGNGVVTITQSANDNWSATCHGMLPETSRRPKNAVIVTPEDDPAVWCGIPWITPTYTRDHLTVIQPNGRVTLSCNYAPNSEGGTWEEYFQE